MKTLRLTVLLLMCAAMASFANGEGDSSASSRDDVLDIAFICKAYNNPFWEYMRVAAFEMAEEEGFNITYLAPTKPYNLEEQTRLVDDVVAKGVDGILLVPVDSVGMVPAVERANRAGIPVAVANTKLQGGDIVTFAAIENYDAMTDVAEYMMKKMDYKGNVVVLEGTSGNQTAIDRLSAIQDVTARYPDVKILASQTANFDRAQGMAVMENLLQSYSNIDAVLSANFEMGLGAIEAIRANGKIGEILVCGFDNTPDGISAIKKGEAVVTMDQAPGAQATGALSALIKHINGEEVPSRIKVDGVLIDENNVDQF